MAVVRAMQEQLPANQKHRSHLIGEDCVFVLSAALSCYVDFHDSTDFSRLNNEKSWVSPYPHQKVPDISK